MKPTGGLNDAHRLENYLEEKRMNKIFYMLILLSLSVLSSCSTNKNFDKDLERSLSENPDIIINALKKNPEKFLMALQSMGREVQASREHQEGLKQKKQFDEAFARPLLPSVAADRVVKGPMAARLTLVEYSDFQCPYCRRGAENVESLMKAYPGEIRIVFKHLPLDFHPQAETAAKYFEALRLQSNHLAWKLRGEIFANQSEIQQGEKFLDQAVKKVGGDLSRLKKDLHSEKVAAILKADQLEAKEFNFQGTPGYLLNGIPVRGAYPVEHFVEIINRLKPNSKGSL